MIKKQQLEDKESYEKEKEEWLAQRIEIEQDLNNFKNKIKDNPTELPSISYDIKKFNFIIINWILNINIPVLYFKF